ncbi:MAG: dihydroneopterin aldolase [Selenomonadaceae bacterium]|nr:dihydroneopterin aldolase [Selenomonadaceae bacterium]
MTDKIILTGLELFGRHGCTEQERKYSQPFVVDAELEFDFSQAGKSDDLADTIDYVAVLADIRAIVEGTPRNLIETVAIEIAETLLNRHAKLDAVKIILRKTDPPVDEKFSGAAVEVTRRRGA